MRDVRELEQALAETQAPDERARLLARMNALLARTPMGRRRGDLRIDAAYFGKITDKLARRR